MVAHPSRRLARPAHTVAVVTLAALAVGCGSGEAGTSATVVDDTGSAPRPSVSADTTGAAPAVPAAFDVRAPLVGGGEIDLAERAGSPLVLWFWAPY
jgi:hypothetical protein